MGRGVDSGEVDRVYRPAVGGILSVWPICSFCGSSMLLAAIRSSVLILNWAAMDAGLSPALTMYVCSPTVGLGGGGAGGTTAMGVGVGGFASAVARPGPVAQFRPTYKKAASAPTTTMKPMMYGVWRLSRCAWLP